MYSPITLLCWATVLISVANCRPHEVQKRDTQTEENVSRARLLLDALSAGTGAIQTLQNFAKVASGGVDVGQQMVNNGADNLVQNSHQFIDTNSRATSDSAKSLADAGGQLFKSFTSMVASVPRFAVNTAQAAIPSASN